MRCNLYNAIDAAQIMRCNVDLLKIIQLGVAFLDEDGNVVEEIETIRDSDGHLVEVVDTFCI